MKLSSNIPLVLVRLCHLEHFDYDHFDLESFGARCLMMALDAFTLQFMQPQISPLVMLQCVLRTYTYLFGIYVAKGVVRINWYSYFYPFNLCMKRPIDWKYHHIPHYIMNFFPFFQLQEAQSFVFDYCIKLQR